MSTAPSAAPAGPGPARPEARAQQGGHLVVPAILGGLGAVLFIMAAIFGWVAHTFSTRHHEALAWPVTEAVIVTSERSVVDARDPRTGQWYEREEYTLEYTYEVDGAPYTGTNFNVPYVGTAHYDPDAHPVGSRRTVHYDPKNPQSSGLQIDAAPGSTGFTILSTGLAAGGLVFAGLALRSWVRARRRPS